MDARGLTDDALVEGARRLRLHTLGGRSIATFWATWCDPCRDGLPLLSDYAACHAEQGLSVLGFCLDEAEDLPKVRVVAARLSFPVGLLGSYWLEGYGRIWRIPVSFVIDRAGRLADNGWEDAQPVWTKQRLRQVVDPLLMRRGWVI
jgi:thiol-disulfide isomerase/thioredoxin